ncbi:MAG: alpha/beta hydrolase [Pseudomonadota bacterium]|nr:alpha/beta hydrolase [Pseudomonadota bacterium]
MSRPVLMLHGAFTGGWCFDELAAIFRAAGYRTIVPDLPGHDRPWPLGPDPDLHRYGIGDYADAMSAVLERLDEPPIVVGHSMGGLIGQMLAARHAVSALVLLAPAAPWGIWPREGNEALGALGLAVDSLVGSGIIAPDYRAVRHGVLDRFARAERRALHARFTCESALALRQVLLWMMDPAGNSAVDHHRVKCPVLCLVGDSDRLVSPGTVRAVAYKYGARAKFKLLRDHSHFLLGEPDWEEWVAYALDWLDTKGLGASPVGLADSKGRTATGG